MCLNNSTVFKSTLLVALILLLSLSAFGQTLNLSLEPSDIRFELVLENENPVGYNLFIRKKPGIESVMLTEPTGLHALRSIAWNPINGNERRDLSGVQLSDTYSRYSILSSTSMPDLLFNEAFHLYIPLLAVYGNPNSTIGTNYVDIRDNTLINIRTFGHRYADPNTGHFSNYLTLVNTSLDEDYRGPGPEHVMERSLDNTYRELRKLLSIVLIDESAPYRFSDFELSWFLNKAFGGF